MGERPQVLQKAKPIVFSLDIFKKYPVIVAQRYRGQGEARETLKAAMKNRPPVAEIVKEITKVKKK